MKEERYDFVAIEDANGVSVFLCCVLCVAVVVDAYVVVASVVFQRSLFPWNNNTCYLT